MTDVQHLVPIAAAFALVGTVMLTSAAARGHQDVRTDQQSRLAARPQLGANQVAPHWGCGL
jgi:hypothetical protein